MPVATYTDNIFDFQSSSRILPAHEGQTLDDLIVQSGLTYDAGPFVVYQDGEPRPRRMWDRAIGKDDVVTVVRFPQGGDAETAQVAIMVVAVVAAAYTAGASIPAFAGISSEVIGGAIQAGIMITAAVASSLLAPGTDSIKDISPTYDQNVQRNVPRLGAPRAVQYGRMRFFPDYATSPYTEYEDNDQYMYSVLDLMLGECDVEKIEIGDVDIDELDDVSYTIHPPGEQVTEFWDSVYQKEVGLKLGYQEPQTVIINLANTETSRAKYDIYFAALYERDSDDPTKQHPFYVDFKIKYREVDGIGNPVGDGTWTPFSSEDGTADCVERQARACANGKLSGCHDVCAQSNDCLNNPNDDIYNNCQPCHNTCDSSYDTYLAECQAMDWSAQCVATDSTLTVHKESLLPVRVTRQVLFPKKARWEIQVERTSLPQTTRAVSAASLMRTRAYFDNTLEYTQSTRLAMKVNVTSDATPEAAGTVAVTATAKHRKISLAGIQGVFPTTNISAALLDIATSSYGGQIADANIDVDALAVLQETWNDRGPGEEDQFNYRFDTRTTIWDALTVAAAAGRSKPVQVGGLLSFVRDQQALSPPSQVISGRNIVSGSLNIDYSIPPTDQPDVVEAVFINRQTWKEDRIICDLGFVPLDPEQTPLTVNMPGITDHDHAWREGMYMAAAIYYRRRRISLGVEYEGQVMLPGDVVPVNYRLMGWGVAGDVDEYNTTSNTLIGDSERITSWNAVNCTVAGSAVLAPNGVHMADTVTLVKDTSVSYVGTTASIPSAGTYTFSCYVRLTKDASRVMLWASIPSGGSTYVLHNYANGDTLLPTDTTVAGVERVDAKDSVDGTWVRLWVVVNSASAGTSTINIYVGLRFAGEQTGIFDPIDYEVPIFGMQCAPGDLRGYVAASAGYTQPGYHYRCSEALEWGTGAHEMLLRQPNGQQDGPFSVEVGAEMSDVLCHTAPSFTPYVDGAKERTHLLHGPEDKHSLLCRVIGIVATTPGSYTISLVNEHQGVHDADSGLPPIPVEIPTLPGDNAAPVVQNLTVNVTLDGANNPILHIGWSVAEGAEYYILQGSTNGVDWADITTTSGTDYTWTPGWIGPTHIRVAGVNLVRGPWAVWVGDTKIATEFVGPTTGLKVVGGFLGNSISISWDAQFAAKDYTLEAYYNDHQLWDGVCANTDTTTGSPLGTTLDTFPLVLNTNSYIYTYEQIVADGGPHARLVVKVWARNFLGSGTPQCLEVNLVALDAPTGLKLLGRPDTEHEWEGLAIRMQWDPVPGAAFYEIKFMDGTTVVQSIDKLINVQAEFTRDQMDTVPVSEGGLGGPWRALNVQVRAENTLGISLWSPVFSVSNPQIAAPTGVNASSSYSFTLFGMNMPIENDYAGTRVWVTSEVGTPPPTTDDYLVYDGVDVNMSIGTIGELESGGPTADRVLLQQGADYRYLIGHYDTFGTGSINTVDLTETMQFLPGGGADNAEPTNVVWHTTPYILEVQTSELIVLMRVILQWEPATDAVKMSHYILEWWDETTPEKVSTLSVQHVPIPFPQPEFYSAVISGLHPGPTIKVRVTAVDWASNQSVGWSPTLSIVLDDGSVAPSQITDLVATEGLDKIVLNWTNPTEENWLRTKIYKEVNQCGTFLPFNIIYDGMGNATIDSDVVAGTDYCYMAVAFSVSGSASPPSPNTGLVSPFRIGSPDGPIDNYFHEAAIVNAYVQHLDASQILANSITADQIQANTITTDEMFVTELSTISVEAGTLTGGTLRGLLFETAPADDGSPQRVQITDVGLSAYNSVNAKTVFIGTDGSGYLGLDSNGNGVLSWNSLGYVQVPGTMIAGRIEGNLFVTPTAGLGNWRLEMGPTADLDGVNILRYWNGTANSEKFKMDDAGNLTITGSIIVTGGDAATQSDLAGIEAGSGTNQLSDPTFFRTINEAAGEKYWTGLDGVLAIAGPYGFSGSPGLRLYASGANKRVTSTAKFITPVFSYWHVHCFYTAFNVSTNPGGYIGIEMLNSIGTVIRTSSIPLNGASWNFYGTDGDNKLSTGDEDATHIRFFVEIGTGFNAGGYIDITSMYLSSTEYNAGLGATWNEVSSKPDWAADERAGAGLDAEGNVVGFVMPTDPNTPSSTGLFMDRDHMGYWDNVWPGTWKTYMDKEGHFYLSGDGSLGSNNGLAWDGHGLTINGQIIIQAGSLSTGIGNFSDAGPLVDAEQIDFRAHILNNTYKPEEGATVGATATEANKLGGIADNATLGATWGSNIVNRPTDLAGINPTEGNKLGGITEGADRTAGFLGGRGQNLIPPEYRLFNGYVLPKFAQLTGGPPTQTTYNPADGSGAVEAPGGYALYTNTATNITLIPKFGIWNIPLTPGSKYIFSVYGNMNTWGNWLNFVLIGNDGRSENYNTLNQTTITFHNTDGTYERYSAVVDLTGSSATRAFMRVDAPVGSGHITALMLEPMVGDNEDPSPFFSEAIDSRVEESIGHYRQNYPPEGTGLFLGSEYMGFYKGNNDWSTYMDWSGRFFLQGASDGSYLQWDPFDEAGSTLRVSGNLETSGTGKRIDINPGNDNELHFWDGNNTEVMTLGISAVDANDYAIIKTGSSSSSYVGVHSTNNIYGAGAIIGISMHYGGYGVRSANYGGGVSLYATAEGGDLLDGFNRYRATGIEGQGNVGVKAVSTKGCAVEMRVDPPIGNFPALGGHFYCKPISNMTSPTLCPDNAPNGTFIVGDKGQLYARINGNWESMNY